MKRTLILGLVVLNLFPARGQFYFGTYTGMSYREKLKIGTAINNYDRINPNLGLMLGYDSEFGNCQLGLQYASADSKTISTHPNSKYSQMIRSQIVMLSPSIGAFCIRKNGYSFRMNISLGLMLFQGPKSNYYKGRFNTHEIIDTIGAHNYFNTFSIQGKRLGYSWTLEKKFQKFAGFITAELFYKSNTNDQGPWADVLYNRYPVVREEKVRGFSVNVGIKYHLNQ